MSDKPKDLTQLWPESKVKHGWLESDPFVSNSNPPQKKKDRVKPVVPTQQQVPGSNVTTFLVFLLVFAANDTPLPGSENKTQPSLLLRTYLPMLVGFYQVLSIFWSDVC